MSLVRFSKEDGYTVRGGSCVKMFCFCSEKRSTLKGMT